MTCKTCGKEYSPDCDYNQGRCPGHPPMFKDVGKSLPRVFRVLGYICLGVGSINDYAILVAASFLLWGEYFQWENEREERDIQ